MAQPTINLCGLKCLVKIIITLVIIIAIIVAAVLIVGNMSLAKLKLDDIKLGDTSLKDLGLSDMSLKSVLKAAYKLGTAKEADFVTNPFGATDQATVDEIFASLSTTTDGTPLYETLLVQKATYAEDKLYTIGDRGLAHIYNQVMAGDSIPAEVKKLGLRVGSVTIDTDAKLNVTFVMDVASVTAGLKKLPFMEWPKAAYLQYAATIAVTSEGIFDTVDPSFTINGLDADATKALLTAVATTAKVEVPEGETLESMITKTIDTVTTKVVENMGVICSAGTTSAGIVNRSDVVIADNAGIAVGTIKFIRYE